MQEAGRVFTVVQVAEYLKALAEGDAALRHITVRGEISNVKYHPSGHIYFTLKDSAASLSGVMFRSAVPNLRFRLENGQQVRASGRITVYTGNSHCELIAQQVVFDGTGALYQELKRRRDVLEQRGVFRADHKKTIPRFAQSVGIVTARTGAAIHDIMSVAQRRNPHVQLIFCPALVQGEQAAESIAEAIRILDREHPDVMIIGRGGGSIEDLWAFNELPVVQAVYQCQIPVISAIGHDINLTLADLAADLYAETPSAAAELAVYDASQFAAALSERRGRLNRLMNDRISGERLRLSQYSQRLERQTPERRLELAKQKLESGRQRLKTLMDTALKDRTGQLTAAAARLEAMSPLRRMQSGYAFVTNGQGEVLRSVNQIHPGEMVDVTLRDGKLRAEVQTVLESPVSGAAEAK